MRHQSFIIPNVLLKSEALKEPPSKKRRLKIPSLYSAFNSERVCQILVMLFIFIGQEEADSSPINIFRYQVKSMVSMTL